jgi:hypothetical protein
LVVLSGSIASGWKMIQKTNVRLACFLFGLGFLLLPGNVKSAALQCPSGKQVLWYFPEEKLDEKTHKGFTRELLSELTGPLSAMGYWLAPFSPQDSIVRSAVYSECLIMRLYLRDAGSDDADGNITGEKEVFVALAKTREWTSAQGDSSSFRTLFSLRYSPKDFNTIQTIFVKKLIENLRTQYICNIAITTEPKGALITAQNGLSDRAPFEWVLPAGSMNIKCAMKKYIPLEKELVFSNPGSYNFFFQLRKRQFYHSGFVYPAAAAGIASGTALAYKYYYWDRYSRLGNAERVNTPDVFAQTFRKVQICERISLASILLSGTFLVLSFRF